MTVAAPPPEKHSSHPGDRQQEEADSRVLKEVDGAHLAYELVEVALGGGWVSVPGPLESVLPLADVTSDVGRFGEQYRFADENRLPLPVIRGRDDPLPVNAESAFFPLGEPVHPGQAFESLLNATRRGRPFDDRGFLELAPPEEAADSFRRRLGRFLDSRVFGVRRLREEGRKEERDRVTPAPPMASAPMAVTARGILFEVFTRSAGLRVHYHPVYWHDPNRVFGQPSSPVVNYLQPGRYVFGAVGPGVPLRFDPAEYDVPGTSRADIYW